MLRWRGDWILKIQIYDDVVATRSYHVRAKGLEYEWKSSCEKLSSGP